MKKPPRSRRFDAAEHYRAHLRLTEEVLRRGGAADENGCLSDQSRLAKVRFGVGTSDRNGCGWIALYNLLRLLGEKPTVAETVREMEGGLWLRGRAGASPRRLIRVLRDHGYRVETRFVGKDPDALAAERAGVVFYLRSRLLSGAHYVAFSPADGAGERRFYNAPLSKGTFRELFSLERPLFALLITAQRREEQ